jgi:hypothetical protein
LKQVLQSGWNSPNAKLFDATRVCCGISVPLLVKVPRMPAVKASTRTPWLLMNSLSMFGRTRNTGIAALGFVIVP